MGEWCLARSVRSWTLEISGDVCVFVVCERASDCLCVLESKLKFEFEFEVKGKVKVEHQQQRQQQQQQHHRLRLTLRYSAVPESERKCEHEK